jgi:hypothetical protein
MAVRTSVEGIRFAPHAEGVTVRLECTLGTPKLSAQMCCSPSGVVPTLTISVSTRPAWRPTRAATARSTIASRPALRVSGRSVTATAAGAVGLGALPRWQEGPKGLAVVNEVRRSARTGVVIKLSEAEISMTHPSAQDKVLELRDVSRAMAKLAEGQREASAPGTNEAEDGGVKLRG